MSPRRVRNRSSSRVVAEIGLVATSSTYPGSAGAVSVLLTDHALRISDVSKSDVLAMAKLEFYVREFIPVGNIGLNWRGYLRCTEDSKASWLHTKRFGCGRLRSDS